MNRRLPEYIIGGSSGRFVLDSSAVVLDRARLENLQFCTNKVLKDRADIHRATSLLLPLRRLFKKITDH